MDYLCKALKSAMDGDAISLALGTLLEIAEHLAEIGDKEWAAQILALLLCYPLSDFCRERAERLMLDLKSELCPRVILDAEQRAQEITLADLVSEILAAEL